MSDVPPRSSLSETANRLIGAVGEMNERLEATAIRLDATVSALSDVADATRRSRMLIRFLAVSLVFDVLLSLGLAFLYNDNREAVREACREGNSTRAGSIALWEATIAGSPTTTPEQQARTERFEAKLHEVYAPRDCG